MMRPSASKAASSAQAASGSGLTGVTQGSNTNTILAEKAGSVQPPIITVTAAPSATPHTASSPGTDRHLPFRSSWTSSQLLAAVSPSISKAATVTKSPLLDDEMVGQYLLDRNYELTALEFYQECHEDGREVQLLKEWFNKNLTIKEDYDVEVSRITRVISSTDVNKDEKIAILERDIREMRLLQERKDETIQKLQRQLIELKETGMEHIVNQGESFSRTDQMSEEFEEVNMDQIFQHPIEQDEIKILGYLVKRFLRMMNYRITLSSFCDECERAVNLPPDDLDIIIPFPAELHHYVRCFEYIPKSIYRKKKENTKSAKETSHAEQISAPMPDRPDPYESSDSSQYGGSASHAGGNDGIYMPDRINTYLDDQILLTSEENQGNVMSIPNRPKRTSDLSSMKSRRPSRRKVVLSRSKKVAVSEVVDDQLVEGIKKSKQMKDQQVPSEDDSQSNQFTDPIHLICVIGDEMSQIISGHQKKRENLINPICAVIIGHPSPKVRQSLTQQLLGLFSTPDVKQRKLILSSLIPVAQTLPDDKFAQDILQSFLEQTRNKSQERRILSIEFFEAFYPYIEEEVQKSRILPVLKHLASDDSPVVRVASIRGLALLIKRIEDQSIYGNIIEVLLNCVTDNSQLVSKEVVNVLFPVLVEWFQYHNILNTELISALLKYLSGHLKRVSQQRAIFSPEAPEQLHTIEVAIELLIETIPSLFCQTLFDGPFSKPILSETKVDLDGITLDHPVIKKLLEGMVEYLTTEKQLGKGWFSVQWLQDEYFPSLIRVIEMTPVTSPTMPSFSKLLNSLCNTFGAVFTKVVIHPYFLTEIKNLGEKIQTEKTQENGSLPMQLLVEGVSVSVLDARQQVTKLFVTGVLPCIDNEELHRFIRDLSIHIALEESDWRRSDLSILIYSLSFLSKIRKFEDDIVNTICEVQTIDSPDVRLVAIECLKELITTVNSSIVANRILPTLLNLSEDPNLAVRSNGVAGLGLILGNTTERNVLEQIVFKIDTIIHEVDYDMIVQVLRALINLIPSSLAFRDSLLFPKMMMIADLICSNPSIPQRKEIAAELVDGYFNCSGCHDIKKEVITDIILPTLRMLNQDADLLEPTKRNQLYSIMKDFEMKLQQESDVPAAPASEWLTRILRATSSLQRGSVMQMFARERDRLKEKDKEKDKEKERQKEREVEKEKEKERDEERDKGAEKPKEKEIEKEKEREAELNDPKENEAGSS